MDYAAPYQSTDPNAPFVNPDPATNTPGSMVPAAAIEHPQREIVNVIAAAGLEPDAADLTQLGQAIAAMIAAGVPADVLRRTVNTGNLAAGYYVTPQALAIAAGVVTPVYLDRNVMTLAVTASITLANPATIPTGGGARIIATLDATGGRALTLGSAYRIIDGAWSADAGAVNILDLVFGGPGGLIDVQISQRGSL